MYSKMQGRGGLGGNGLWLCAPRSSNTMISPGSMSRTYLAPIMSSAQVSEVRIGWPSRSPSTSGRMPSGWRAPISFLLVRGRLHHGAVKHQLAAQRQSVGEVAVVADRETAGIELGEQRLHVAQDGGAGGGIADMADRDGAGQTP